MRRPLALPLILLLAAPAVCPQETTPAPRKPARAAADPLADPLLRAMMFEVRRARLLVGYGEAPFFVSLAVDENENVTLQASLGASFAPQRSRFRLQRPYIHVGSQTLDNTGYIGSDQFTGTRFDSDRLPLDNDVYSLRAAFWLGLDRSYKTAVQAIGKKLAALSYYAAQDRLPDYMDAPKLTLVHEIRKAPLDEARWDERVRQLSAVFRGRAGVTSALSELSWSSGADYYYNSDGTTLRVPDRLAVLRLRATAAIEKGGEVYHGLEFVALDPADLPGDAELKRAASGTAAELEALAQAPAGEAYTGPVLFEAHAAAQLVAEVFGQELSLVRKPIAEKGRDFPLPQSGLEGRIGARVLPSWMSLRDDSTRKEWNGAPLAGFYEADLEGVAPVPVTLVDHGILKNYLTTRQPVKAGQGSNGHARLPGAFGAQTARAGNLFLEAGETTPDAQLKQRLLDMVKQQNKPFGLLVRRMDFPSFATLSSVREMAMRQMRSGGGARLFSAPLLLYRVYPDGHEELVRGMRFKNLNVRLFRDILAAGDRPALFQYEENGAPMALNGGGGYVVGCASVAPAVLFEEMDLDSATEEADRPPLVPPPPPEK